jgi:hypothetical protein
MPIARRTLCRCCWGSFAAIVCCFFFAVFVFMLHLLLASFPGRPCPGRVCSGCLVNLASFLARLCATNAAALRCPALAGGNGRGAGSVDAGRCYGSNRRGGQLLGIPVLLAKWKWCRCRHCPGLHSLPCQAITHHEFIQNPGECACQQSLGEVWVSTGWSSRSLWRPHTGGLLIAGCACWCHMRQTL